MRRLLKVKQVWINLEFLEIEDPVKKELCFLQKNHKIKHSNWVEILTDGRWKSNQNETNLLLSIGSPIVTVIWNDIQQTAQCCGLDGQDDWLDSYFGKIPPTCCNAGKMGNFDTIHAGNQSMNGDRRVLMGSVDKGSKLGGGPEINIPGFPGSAVQGTKVAAWDETRPEKSP